MRFLGLLLLWTILLVLCWPLAFLFLLAWPLLWLLSIPFRLVAVFIEAVFSLIRSLLLLPSKLLA